MRPHGCPWGPHGIPQVGERRGRGGGRGGGGGWGRGGRGAGGKGRMGEVRLRVCAWAPWFSGALLGLPGPCWAHLATYGLPLALLGFPGLSDNCRDNRQTTAVTMAGQPP